MEQLSLKIAEFEKKADQLQQQAKYFECLTIYEEILNLKREYFGEESDQFFRSTEKLCELFNLIAMIFLRKEKLDMAYDFLKKAEMFSVNSEAYRAITLNNLACYYRHIGKLRIALSYLEQAQLVSQKTHSNSTLADTHLNTCAVLSQLNKHDKALEHILMAIVLLQDEVLTMKECISDPDKYLLQHNQGEEEEKEIQEGKLNIDVSVQLSDIHKKLKERIPVLGIAYHNLGAEFEFLNRMIEAVKSYEKGVKYASRMILENQEDNPLLQNLTNVLQQANASLQKLKNASLPVPQAQQQPASKDSRKKQPSISQKASNQQLGDAYKPIQRTNPMKSKQSTNSPENNKEKEPIHQQIFKKSPQKQSPSLLQEHNTNNDKNNLNNKIFIREDNKEIETSNKNQLQEIAVVDQQSEQKNPDRKEQDDHQVEQVDNHKDVQHQNDDDKNKQNIEIAQNA